MLECPPDERITLSPFLKWYIERQLRDALVITFKNRKLLVLQIAHLENGRRVMEQIVASYGPVSTIPFSEAERKALSRRLVNVLLSL